MELTKEEMMEAISEGVKRAFWQLEIIPCSAITDAIKDGVEKAVHNAMPYSDQIENIIHHAIQTRSDL